MKEMPKVSIVLVNYNSSDHTLECINSLMNIDYKNFEIIIVDNASGMLERKKLDQISLENVKIINSDVNLGFSGGNNLCISEVMSNSEFILLLNNDTVVEQNFLTELVMAAKSNKNIGIVCPQIFNYYNRSEVSYAGGDINYLKGSVYIVGINDKRKDLYEVPRKISFATGCCMLINSKVFKDVGLLPEEYFLYFEDTDFSVRVIRKGYSIWYQPTAKIYHKESVSTKRYSDNYQYYFVRNRFYFIKKNYLIVNKFTAYPISLLYVIKKILEKKFTFRNSFYAIRDFLNNNMGKRRER